MLKKRESPTLELIIVIIFPVSVMAMMVKLTRFSSR